MMDEFTENSMGPIVEIKLRTVDDSTGTLRIRRQRATIAVRYAGVPVAAIPAKALADHLATVDRPERDISIWGDLEVCCGRGEVRIGLRREIRDQPLTDRARQELTALAGAPG